MRSSWFSFSLISTLTLAVISSAVVVLGGVHPVLAQGKGPVLVIDNPIYNFGKVHEGQKVVHQFTLQNTGNANLRIERLVPACGCTATTASKDIIEPSSSGTIQVEFDTNGFSGDKTKTVRVYTSDNQQPSVLLSLKGSIVPDLVVEPQALRFGSVAKGRESEFKKTFSLVADADSPVRVASVKSFSDLIVLEALETKNSKNQRYSVSISEDAPVGTLRERIVVSLAGGARKSVTIPVLAQVEGELHLSPSTLSFGVIQGSAKKTRSVSLQNRGGTEIAVKKVLSNHPAIKAKVHTVESGKSYRLDIELDPSRIDGNLRATLEIATTSSMQEKVNLNIYGVLPPKV